MKKTFLFFIAIAALLGIGVWLWRAAGLALWQEAGNRQKSYVVGVVRNPPTLDIIWESFRVKMRELGYGEGKNITYKVIEVGGDAAETKKKVALLIDEGVDIIYPLGGLAVHAAKAVTEERRLDLPVVFGIYADPVRAKLVASLKIFQTTLILGSQFTEDFLMSQSLLCYSIPGNKIKSTSI